MGVVTPPTDTIPGNGTSDLKESFPSHDGAEDADIDIGIEDAHVAISTSEVPSTTFPGYIRAPVFSVLSSPCKAASNTAQEGDCGDNVVLIPTEGVPSESIDGYVVGEGDANDVCGSRKRKPRRPKQPRAPKKPKKEKIPKDKKVVYAQSLDSTFDDALVWVLGDVNFGAGAPLPASIQRWAFAGGKAAPYLTIRDHDAGRSVLATHLECEAACAELECSASKSCVGDSSLNTPCDAVNGQSAGILHVVIGCDEAGRGPLAGPLTCASYARLYWKQEMGQVARDEAVAAERTPPSARDSKAIASGVHRRAMFGRLAGQGPIPDASCLDALLAPRGWLIENSKDAPRPFAMESLLQYQQCHANCGYTLGDMETVLTQPEKPGTAVATKVSRVQLCFADEDVEGTPNSHTSRGDAASITSPLCSRYPATSSLFEIVQFASVVVVNNGAVDAAGISLCMMSATADAAVATRCAVERWVASHPDPAIRRLTGRLSFSVLMDGANVPLELFSCGDLVLKQRDALSFGEGEVDFADARFQVVLPVIKGDSKSYSVAAASVLAKVTRDDIMGGKASWWHPPISKKTAKSETEQDVAEAAGIPELELPNDSEVYDTEAAEQAIPPYSKIFPMYLFAENSGYGTAEHTAAIREYGLSPIHRKSFRLRTSGTDEMLPPQHQ